MLRKDLGLPWEVAVATRVRKEEIGKGEANFFRFPLI